MRTDVRLTSDKSITVVSDDDVEDVLDNNKRLRGVSQKSDWGRHVASIPCVVIVHWLNEEWERGNNIRYLSKEWYDLVRAKLQDPDFAYLRVDR